MKRGNFYLLLIVLVLVLSFFAVGTITQLSLTSPVDNNWTSDTTPKFQFTPISDVPIGNYNFTCELFVNNVGYGKNTTTFNGTLTALVANTSLINGSYSWYVNCTDMNGTIKSSVRTFNVDTAVPSIILNHPLNLSNQSSAVVFNFTAADNLDTNLSYVLIIDGAGNKTGFTGSNGTDVVFSQSGFLDETTYYWTVQVNDSAGNTFTYSPLLYFTVDAVSPVTNLVLVLNNTWTNDSTRTISFNATDNKANQLRYTVYVDGVARNTSSMANNTQTSIVLGALSSGTHNVSVRAEDAAGNTDDSSILVLKIDNAVPTSTVSSPLNHTWTTDTTPSITFTLTDDADTLLNYTIYVDGTAYNRSTVANNTAKTVAITSVLSNGNHTVRVEALDNVDRRTNSSAVLLKIDSVAPAANLVMGLNGTWTTDSTPDIVFNITDNLDAVLNYTVYVDSVARNKSVIANNTQLTLTLAALSSGTHRVHVYSVDQAGNTDNSSVLVLKIDNAVPTSTVSSPLNHTWTTDQTPNINFTLTDDADTLINYTVYVDGTAYNRSTVANNTPTVITLTTAAFTNGNHTIRVEALDSADRRTNSSAVILKVDTVVPTANLKLTANNTWTTDVTPDITFNITDNLDAVLNYTVYVDSVARNKSVLANNTPLTLTLAALSSGTHRIFVYSIDQAGNTDNSSVLVLKVDNVAPRAGINRVNGNSFPDANNTWFIDNTLDIYLNATDNIDLSINTTIYVDSVARNNSLLVNGTPTTITMAALSEGTHRVFIRSLDDAGNSFNSSIYTLKIDTVLPGVNITSPVNDTTTKDNTPTLTANITDNLDTQLNYTLYINNVLNQSGQVSSGDIMQFNITALADGVYVFKVAAEDNANHRFNRTLEMTIDTVAPIFESAASINSPDIYFASGDVLNVSVNFTDATSSVQNMTFNLSQVCSAVLTTKTARSGGVYWANCTVDKNQNFQTRNLTYTSCDIAGNCGTGLLTSVVLYNFTRPSDSLPLMSFDSSLTTDLSNEADLENVSWQLGININGDLLPGQPWSGLRLAAFLNFSSINFTDPDTQQALAGLMTALNITIRDPRDGAYGGSRIYIDTTAFAELDTATDIELYGLPFADVDTEDLLNDTGGNGGISDILFESNGDGTGNLSFTVLGFSGYNVTDLADPVIDVNLPLNSTYVSSFRFNATFNGTGTEIDNSSINITIGAYYFSYENLTCTYTNNREVLNCAAVLPVANGVYNFTVSVKDFGGSSGNTDTYSGFFVTVDNTIPTATITTATSWTTDTTPDVSFNLSDNVDLLINYTVFVDGVANRRGSSAPGASTVTLLAVSEANHTVKVEAMDSNGNRQNSSVISLIVDNTNPGSNLRLTSNNTWTTDSTPTVYFNMTDNLDRVLNYTVFVDAVARNRSIVANGTNLGITLATLTDGTHNIKVQATDDAGKRVNSSVLVLKVDSTNPSVTLNIPTNSSNVSDTTVSFNFTGTDNIDANMSYQFFVNGDLNRSGYTNTNNSDITFSVGSFDDSAEYNWTVEVTDNAGNRVNATVQYFTVDDTTGLSTYPTLRSGNVTDSDSDGNIELVWAADSNAAYYRIYRNTSNITDATNLDALDTVTGTAFEDNTTVNGTTYWYVITSLDASQNEDKTVVSESFYATANDSVMPNLGSNLNASTNANGAVFVSWDAVLLDVYGNADLNPTYRVFRTTNLSALNTSSSEEIIANTTDLNYTDTNMTTGTNYTYVITSVDDGLNHNSSKASYKVIVPAECTTSYTYGSWSSCVSGEKTRTGTRTCYGGGNTTITDTDSCSSGGGSGGGGSSSSSSAGSSLPSSDDPTAIRLWMGLSEGTETKMTIQDERFSVTEILVRIAGAVSSMQMTVQDIETKPTQLPDVTDKAFKYFKIDKTAQDSAIGSAVIKFKVEKKWLSENGLDKSTVALERYVTKWVKLATKLLSEDDDFVYYEAESPGFSYFAVTAKAPGTVTEPVPEVIVPVVEPPTPAVEEKAPPVEEEKVPPKPKSDKPNVLLLVLVALLIIIAGYLLYKKPKAHEHDLDKIAKELDDLKKKKH